MEKQALTLSASRIKTLETCSWIYWCNYHLKLPEKTNEGALRGSICHLIFELLILPKHKTNYDALIKANSISGSQPVKRLVVKHLKKSNILTSENFLMVDEMILVGLKNDFFCSDDTESPTSFRLGEPEKEFLIESQNPKYRIKGFIDKHAVYDDKIKIIDYKSSKKKFKDEELTANIQALTYTLAVEKSKDFESIRDKVREIITEFIFLRFPKQPIQEVRIKPDEVKGYEKYLAYIYKIAESFNEKTAKSNFASDKQGKGWMCKAGATWRCPYLDSFDYFAIIDQNDKIKKCYFTETEALQAKSENDKIEARKYEGCPAHVNKRPTKVRDDFDF